MASFRLRRPQAGGQIGYPVPPPLEFVRIFVELWQPVWWAAVAVGSNLGGLHAPEPHTKLIVIGPAITTRSTASQITRAASHT